MTFNEYQTAAMRTAIFRHEYYPAASLMIEAAELADILTKPLLRGDPVEIDKEELLAEAGDVLWNLTVLLHNQGISLEDVAIYNIKKLTRRAACGTILGSGNR